ncbi:MAG TPA: TetR/AcrR family transcriptional regulator [Candidatus Onthomonas avicola]|nr:TetR/AcrR family transcriptional regulator [Candidatus Onthomonas avicola]
MTQKERQERSKETIYQAALEEFGTYGYDRVNMERICGNHGISKGMMYHYYSSKDELFLLCVKRTFDDLKAHIERDVGGLEGFSTQNAIKHYFMIRENFFLLHPKQKVIFENAVFQPPEHLNEQIIALRAPIQAMNQQFIGRFITQASLRSELNQKKATRYLESVSSFFRNMMAYYQGEKLETDLHSMLETAEELLDMVLFGILRQTEAQASFPADQTQAPTDLL